MVTFLGGKDKAKIAEVSNPVPVCLSDGTEQALITADGRLLVSTNISGGTIYTVPPFTATGSFAGNQAAVTLATPTGGKKIQVIGVLITGDDSVFTATIEFITSGITITEHFEQGTLGSYIPVNLTGDTDEVVSFTTTGSAGQNWFVTLNYSEID